MIHYIFMIKQKSGDALLKNNRRRTNKFKSNLNEITTGDPKHKSKGQLDTIKDVKNLCDSKQKIINLFNDSARIRSEASYKIKQDETK